jgi:hypothetical protein
VKQHTINRDCYITTAPAGDTWTATLVHTGTVIANVTGYASEATAIEGAADVLRALAGNVSGVASKVARRTRG